MPGDWSYEQTRSLVGVQSQTNVQGERDDVTRNPVVFKRIAAKEMGEMGYEFSRKQCHPKTKKLTHRHQIYTERRVASNVAVALGTQALSYNSWRN